MPITLKTVKSVDFLKGLSLPDEVFQAAATLAWTFGPQVVTVRNAVTETTLSLPCKLSLAKAIVAGTASTLMFAATRERVVTIVASLTEGDGLQHYAQMQATDAAVSQAAVKAFNLADIAVGGPPEGPEDDYVLKLPVSKPAGSLLKPSSAAPILNSLCTLDEMRTAPTLPLAQASRLYQPVKASNGGSRYFAIALRPDLKIAARWRNGRVSMRAEGSLSSYATHLQAAGFSMNSGYASAHFEVPDKALARKTIGAVLFGLGVAFPQMIQSANVLDGEGA